MARISGVDIPRDKHVHISLRYIYGIGPTTALKICDKTRVNPSTRVRDLTEEELARLREVIDREHKVEGDLRREINLNIKRLIEIGCYRQPEHQAADRDRLLPRAAPPARSAGPWAAHPHQRPDAQGTEEDRRRAQEGGREEVARPRVSAKKRAMRGL
jgi:small subunit ribosomal protein S13